MAEKAQKNLLKNVLGVLELTRTGQRQPPYHIAPTLDHAGALLLIHDPFPFLLYTGVHL